ncbi:DUF169 domain-containing protein [uncultured Anaerococcus sp.]|uniref:DUF169 domain-containing protein n=1 Tax=uncultured Anaerococcus sp. TaxID=293428 RepID=UPI002603DD14|nr:DUF169 domain-containing protein [uncultured Anaerococcus sp.]
MNIKESSDLINIYLDLEREPVAVKFLHTEEEYQDVDLAEREHKVSYCNAVALASLGQAMKVKLAHQACPNGAAALGLKEVPEPMKTGAKRHELGIYDSVETSKEMFDEMDLYNKKVYGLAISPLNETNFTPDVVILISKSYNIMRTIQGYSYKYGYDKNIKTVGLQAVCHDLTNAPMLNDGINISFLCPGTRLVADWQEDELGVGVNFNKWFDTVDGVIKTTNPFARNDKKENIIKKLEEKGMDSSHIVKNKNYDTGSYTGGKVEL